MIEVDCYLGRFREELRDPGISEEDLRIFIEGGFNDASTEPGGTQNLAVSLHTHRRDFPTMPLSRPTNSLSLRESLRLLIADQPTTPSPKRVGLLLADRFEPRPSLFGLMFDEAFVGTDPPREGCVVFLDAIHAKRSHQAPNAYSREVRFTGMHELGHVFNLWHRQSPLSFMSSSGDIVHEPSAFCFLAEHEHYLRIDTEEHRPFLEPAGSDFGKRANGFPQGMEPFGFHNAPQPSDSTIRISGPKSPFFYFEPIELEISLRTTRKTVVAWPDQIDPGYGNFAIWIEDPAGERRRYRSPKHFASNFDKIWVTANRPFVRDISIFGESGGFTFRHPGIHRITVTFEASSRRRLVSNTIELELLPNRPADGAWSRLHEALVRPRVASLLYHRSGVLSPKDRSAIAPVLQARSKSRSAAGLNYAIGRHSGDAAVRHRKFGKSVSNDVVKRAIDHLSRASDSDEVNKHRRNKAEHLIEQLRHG